MYLVGEAYELLDSQFKEAVSDPQLKVILMNVRLKVYIIMSYVRCMNRFCWIESLI